LVVRIVHGNSFGKGEGFVGLGEGNKKCGGRTKIKRMDTRGLKKEAGFPEKEYNEARPGKKVTKKSRGVWEKQLPKGKRPQRGCGERLRLRGSRARKADINENNRTSFIKKGCMRGKKRNALPPICPATGYRKGREGRRPLKKDL